MCLPWNPLRAQRSNFSSHLNNFLGVRANFAWGLEIFCNLHFEKRNTNMGRPHMNRFVLSFIRLASKHGSVVKFIVTFSAQTQYIFWQLFTRVTLSQQVSREASTTLSLPPLPNYKTKMTSLSTNCSDYQTRRFSLVPEPWSWKTIQYHMKTNTFGFQRIILQYLSLSNQFRYSVKEQKDAINSTTGCISNVQSITATTERKVLVPVIVHDSVEPVSHSQDSTVSELCPDCVLDQCICLQINCCCGFIQNENSGFPQHSSG